MAPIVRNNRYPTTKIQTGSQVITGVNWDGFMKLSEDGTLSPDSSLTSTALNTPPYSYLRNFANNAKYSRVKVNEDSIWGLGTDGVLYYSMEGGMIQQISLPSGRTIVAFTEPEYINPNGSDYPGYVTMLTDDGSVWESTVVRDTDSTASYTVGQPARKTFAADTKIVQISHSAALDEQGRIWTWGVNRDGSGFGDGNTGIFQDQPKLITIPDNTMFKKIATTHKASSGGYASAEAEAFAAIDTNGNLWTWGTGEDGSLADGNTKYHQVLTPTKVNTLPSGVKLTEIDGSDLGFSALDEQGHVWSWGTMPVGDGGLSSNDAKPHRALGFETDIKYGTGECVAQMPTTGAPEGLTAVGLLAVSIGLLAVATVRRGRV